jgi:hypothetical protein
MSLGPPGSEWSAAVAGTHTAEGIPQHHMSMCDQGWRVGPIRSGQGEHARLLARDGPRACRLMGRAEMSKDGQGKFAPGQGLLFSNFFL